MIHITILFQRSAKLAYVSAKNFRLGRGSVVLLRIYLFVRSASQSQDTTAFASLLDLEISFTNGIIHTPVAESLAVFHNELITEHIPIRRRPVSRKKRSSHRKSSDRVLLKAMRVLASQNSPS
jgi:hypothetical protein